MNDDSTEKAKADDALRDSEQRLLDALSTDLGIWDYDLTEKKVRLSPRYSKYFGRPPRTQDEWLSLIHPDDRYRLMAIIRERLTGTRHGEPAEFRVLLPDGSVRWLLATVTVLRNSEGQPVRALGVSVDITERKNTEAELRRSEQLNKQVLDIIPDCIFVLDVTPDHRFRFARLNPAEEKAVGYSSDEVSGKFVDEVLPQDVAQRVIAHYSHCLETGELIQYDDELQLPVGRRFFHTKLIPLRDAGGRISRIVGCCRDLTEVKRDQEQALARQKLESMGVLAEGVAHDFNNLMGAILASSELALTDSGIPSSVNEELRSIRTAAIRGAEIVQQLMTYGGKSDRARESVDVGLLVQEMLALLKVSISKHAALDIRIPESLPSVQANPSQLRQVVMNLVLNASEAIGERQGVIRITAALATVTRQTTGMDKTVPALAQYLQLEISDTGVGMTPEVKAKVFDPFFTTKFPGRGMGLAVVQAILRDHQGAIEFVSHPGRGTTCLVWLPCGAAARKETQPPAPAATVHKVEARPGTILVVEDEDLLRLAVSKALKKAGFSIIEAADGTAAIELLRSYPGRLDTILLDVTLPGISSRQILEEIRGIRPDSKVVLTSAYSEENVVSSFAGLRVDRFIRKPFGLADLLTALQETIEGQGPDPRSRSTQ